MSTSVWWVRRDLRLADNPALLGACTHQGPVVPLFVLDPVLWASAGAPRQARLLASLRSLDADLRARYAVPLVIRVGSPAVVVPALAAEVGAGAVHVTAETTPFGRRRDTRVRAALQAHGREFVATGTAYAIGPGTVRTGGGTAYRVFTPFAKAWRGHGAPGPAPAPSRLTGVGDLPSHALPPVVGDAGAATAAAPASASAGEAAARRRWEAFLADGVADYGERRDRPDWDGTSRLSEALKFGEIHPRTLLADLAASPAAASPGAATFVTELAWREFYADVLWHQPTSAWNDLRPMAGMAYDEPGAGFEAWRQGRTGFPFVDAGMRQLAATGWMHNRVRMVTASFLVKDLHLWWPHGARHFMAHLADGDLASNSHGWQWCAGTGTDAAPYFRVFNPVGQGLRFDPDGGYVRRWIPELAHLAGAAAHEPWRHPQGYAAGYPSRILDHAAEREEALRRYAAART